MIISSLERQKKYLVKLCFDNGEELFLDRDICAENSLCEDMEIEAEELKKLSFESDYRRAKSKALWYLDRSDYTEKAMYQKLLRAGFEKRASAAAIARLVELGVIDDRRFAERYYERCCESNISKREALHKMLNKGITYDLAKEMLDGSEVNEEEQIKNLLERKYSSKLAAEKGAEKVFAALMRKGFSYSAIRSAMKQYNEELEFSEEY